MASAPRIPVLAIEPLHLGYDLNLTIEWLDLFLFKLPCPVRHIKTLRKLQKPVCDWLKWVGSWLDRSEPEICSKLYPIVGRIARAQGACQETLKVSC